MFPYFVDSLKAGKSVAEAFKECFAKVTREIFEDQVGRNILLHFHVVIVRDNDGLLGVDAGLARIHGSYGVATGG